MSLEINKGSHTQPRRRENSKNMDINPESLLWRYAGDRRIYLTFMSAGLLQLMHPVISSAVTDKSVFFHDPIGRVSRSVGPILGSIYGLDPRRTGHEIRDIHKNIKGKDQQGKQYHALDPEAFWWAHATFQNAVSQVITCFDGRKLTPEEEEQFYQDSTIWYSHYGMTYRPVPETFSAFEEKWNRICANTLELTPAAERATAMVEKIPFAHIFAYGLLPEIVRERLNIPWSTKDQILFTSFTKSLAPWKFLPKNLRYTEIAQAGMARVQESNSSQGSRRGVLTQTPI